MKSQPELTDVNTDQEDHGLESYITVDRDRPRALHLTNGQIDNTLYDAFGQRQVSTIYKETNQYKVVMEVDPRFYAGSHGPGRCLCEQSAPRPRPPWLRRRLHRRGDDSGHPVEPGRGDPRRPDRRDRRHPRRIDARHAAAAAVATTRAAVLATPEGSTPSTTGPSGRIGPPQQPRTGAAPPVANNAPGSANVAGQPGVPGPRRRAPWRWGPRPWPAPQRRRAAPPRRAWR